VIAWGAALSLFSARVHATTGKKQGMNPVRKNAGEMADFHESIDSQTGRINQACHVSHETYFNL